MSRRFSLSNRMTKSNFFSPSKTLPAVFPAKPMEIMSFSSWMLRPYRAILDRLYFTFISGRPAIFSTEISAAPGTLCIRSPISFPFLARMSRFSPNILMAISARTPVISSLKRISIGWVNSTSMPGMTDRASLNLSASSSLDSADVHSSLGFNTIITSLSSMDMGSVGTSAAPILVTTCLTSGNCSKRMLSISVVISTVLLRAVPVFNTGWITKSPSSKVGTNSPPMDIYKEMAIAKSTAAKPKTIFLLRRAQSIIGSYFLVNQCINRTEMFLSVVLEGFRNREDTTGT